MSEVQVLRRAVRWDLTSNHFSSRAVISDLKIKISGEIRVSELVTNWRNQAIGNKIIRVFSIILIYYIHSGFQVGAVKNKKSLRC